jgi:Protein of unknown function (DUF1153)
MRREQIAGENGPLIADRDRCRLIAGLPPTEIRRWSFRRKAAVILGVRARLLSPQQACGRYLISPEKLAAWGRLSIAMESRASAPPGYRFIATRL